MSDESEALIHFAGIDIAIGPLRRQRCSWCGALIQDDDLSRMAWQLNPDGSDPGPPGMWPVGELIAVDRSDGGGGILWVVEHTDGDDLPPGTCFDLPAEITA